MASVRRTLTRPLAYALAATVVGLCLFASVVPSPLYGTYSSLWHLSSLLITLVYAIYAVGVLVSLLVFGRLSDQVGRRPVLLVSIATLILSLLLFVLANSAAWLFLARGLQGIATGAALSAASATLLDLHVRRDSIRVSLTNGVASCSGLGLGLLVSSSLVQAGTHARALPYVVAMTVAAICLVGAFWMPEPVRAQRPYRLTPQKPGVPPAIRHPFLLAGLAVASSWSIGGLLFSLGGQLSARIFATTDVVTATAAGALFALSAAVAQVVFHRSRPWVGASAGSVVLAAGSGVIVVAAATETSALLIVGSIVAGIGFGVAFLGGLRNLLAVIPPEHRAAVMSAFYVVAYISLSAPAVMAGVVVGHLGPERTFEIFGSADAVLALTLGFEAWRTRPARPAAPVINRVLEGIPT